MMGFRIHSRPGSASTAKHTSRDRDLLAEECVRGAPADRRDGVVQGRMAELAQAPSQDEPSRGKRVCNFLGLFGKALAERVNEGILEPLGRGCLSGGPIPPPVLQGGQ